MAIRIIVFTVGAVHLDKFAGAPWALDGAIIRVGRARRCDLRLPDLSVSPHHASLVRDAGSYALVDEGSAHGTCVEALDEAQSVRLVANDRHPIFGPTLAHVGPFRLLICPNTSEPAFWPSERDVSTSRLLALALASSGKPHRASVLARRGPQKGARFFIEDGLLEGHVDNPSCVFGRDDRADVRLRGKDVSRRHFELLRRKSALWARDLGSTNGTWLDDDRLPPRSYVRWKRWASLRAGEHIFDQEDPLADATDELNAKEDSAFTSEHLPTFSPADEEAVRRHARNALARDDAAPDANAPEAPAAVDEGGSPPPGGGAPPQNDNDVG